MSGGRSVRYDTIFMAPIPIKRKSAYLRREYDEANLVQSLSNATPFTHDFPHDYYGSTIKWNKFASRHFGDEVKMRFGFSIKGKSSYGMLNINPLVVVMEGVDDGRRIYFKDAKYEFLA